MAIIGRAEFAYAEPLRDGIFSTLNNARTGKYKDLQALRDFYKERDFNSLWVKGTRLNDEGEDLYTEITQSWTHGLNPYSYHLSAIEKMIEEGDEAGVSDLELLLSDAYVRLGQDLSGIRVNPSSLDSHISYWQKPLSASALLAGLGKGQAVERLLKSYAPQGQTYERLREELRDLVSRPAPEYESVLPISISGVLKPGQRHPRVIDLKARLDVRHSGEGRDVYDDALAQAIIEFQRDNGLKPDGLIGRQTLDVLNITREDKIGQVIANLERLRWVSDNKPDKFVVVNIPSATLWAVEGGRVELEMPVIVGRTDRPTNMFVTEIHGVRFNPTWTVPKTIKQEDILPELRSDPEYLRDKGMELIMGHGSDAMTIDPVSIDWSEISENDMKFFSMVQTPGGHNPLGRVRVLMPNRYNIYLHDTNMKRYFEKATRALSSGCVRMKEPEKMADFIMKDRSGWNDDSKGALFQTGKMKDLYVKDPIPVYLLYYTVWVNDDDRIVYGRDLYGHDKKLMKMLSNLDGIFIPVDNNGNIRRSSSYALN